MLTLRQMRRNAAGIAILIIIPGALIAWLWSSTGSASAPEVPTGASFNLTVARVRSAQSAAAIAGRLVSSGLPAFTRTLHSGAWHQVVVGPYVSIDEAERVQRRLRGQGLGVTMLVDESVRRVVGTTGVVRVAHVVNQGTSLVLVGAAGRLSLVLEMAGKPAKVRTLRGAGSLLEVEVGPLMAPVSSRVWNGPESAGLVNQVALEEFERDGASFLRAKMALSNPVESRVRVVGSRVYIDFWAATKKRDLREPDSSAVALAEAERLGQEEETPAELTIDEYQEAIGPAIARFQSVHPFAMAALQSPSPDVLTALAGSLADLDTWIQTIEPPSEAAADHAAFVGSVQQVLRAVRAATPSPPPSTARPQ